MPHRRYGKFCFRDYYPTWFGIIFLSAMIIAAFCLDISPVLSGYAGILIIIMLWSVFAPHQERFSISGSHITAMKRKKTCQIDIPERITVVVSYADICPPLTKRAVVGNTTHILKDKYAITLLERITMEDALEHLHRDHMYEYTTNMMEDLFGCKYLYHFVGNQELFDYVCRNRDCIVIIPESLADKIFTNDLMMDTYIDIGY